VTIDLAEITSALRNTRARHAVMTVMADRHGVMMLRCRIEPYLDQGGVRATRHP
jgi:hypothetical protein